MLKILRKNMIFLIVFCLLLTTTAFAQNPQNPPPGSREEFQKIVKARMDEIIEELGISPEQKEKLEAQRKKHMEELKALRAKSRKKRNELRDVIKSKDVNMEEIKRLKKELLDLHAKDIDQKVEATLFMKEVLTEEQFNNLSEKIETRRKNRKKRRDRIKKVWF